MPREFTVADWADRIERRYQKKKPSVEEIVEKMNENNLVGTIAYKNASEKTKKQFRAQAGCVPLSAWGAR